MIGWYVHDHGSGHRRRLEAVATHLRTPVTGMGSGPPAAGVDWLDLPSDASGGPAHDPTAGGTLHWAPLGEPGLLGRARELSRWAETAGCRLLVVDVSVEMLLLGRLLGLPTVAVLQPGDRGDRAHRNGYDTAAALLAPWPREAEGSRLLDRGPSSPHPSRTTWTGAFSDADSRVPAVRPEACRGRRCVALVLGRGGHSVRSPDVHAAAAATPEWHWHVVGGLDADDDPLGTARAGRAAGSGDLHRHGWVDDAWPVLSRCDVVVGPPGGGLVGEVAAAGLPFLALPQPRPFGEQEATARLLRRVGCATVARRWPAAGAWPGLLDGLLAAAPEAPARWRRWSDGLGAQRAARLLDRLAAGRHPAPAGRLLPGDDASAAVVA